MSGAAKDERLVNPIYEAIDSKNFKLAIRESDKLLKKRPDWALVLALKSLAYLRSGKQTESAAVTDKVVSLKPDDWDTLRLLRHSLIGCGRASEFPQLVQEAFEKHSDQLELGLQCAMGYVRVWDWKNLQKVAFKLYKTFDDSRLIYWACMSMYLQSLTSPTPQSQQMVLTLALRLIQTPTLLSSPTNSPYQNPEHLYVLLTILQALPGKSEEVYNIINSEKASSVVKGSLVLEELRWNIVCELKENRGILEKEWLYLEDKISGQGDMNHIHYLNLITLSLWLDKMATDINEEINGGPGASIDEKVWAVNCGEVFKHMDERVGKKERGPLLAMLELAFKSSPNPQDSELPGLVEQYFERFSTKPCCYDDLKPYLPLYSSSTANSLRLFLSRFTASTPGDKKQLQQTINAFKVLRFTSEPDLQAQEEVILAKKYMALYKTCLSFGEGLETTDFQPVDDLAILAANSFISAWSTTRLSSYLSAAVSLLNHAQTFSKYNHYFRFLLIRLYRLLSCPSLFHEDYVQIKVASTQMDTLSHLVLERANMYSFVASGDTQMADVADNCDVYSFNEKDTPEMLVATFLNSTYTQILSFIEFQGRLDHSLQRRLTDFEEIRMYLTGGGAPSSTGSKPTGLTKEDIFNSLEGLEVILKEDEEVGLQDNRDFKLFPTYQAKTSGDDVGGLIQIGGDVKGITRNWLVTLSKAYMRVLSKEDLADKEEDTSELTPSEKSLVKLSYSLNTWAKDILASEANKDVMGFFEESESRALSLATTLESVTTLSQNLPWEIMHVASTALEGFTLLEIWSLNTFPELAGAAAGKQAKSKANHPSHAAKTRAIAHLTKIAAVLDRLSGTTEDGAVEAGAILKGCQELMDDTCPTDSLEIIAQKVVQSRRKAYKSLSLSISARIGT